MFIKAFLYANGRELPLSGAKYTEPNGVLGGSLTAALAVADTSGLPVGAEINFTVHAGKYKDGAIAWSPVTLLDTGRLAGRSITVKWEGERPGDTLSISALTPFTDRWALAPARPVIMFDPDKVDAASLNVDPAQLIQTEGGKGLIYPQIEPIAGLSLRQVLSRAYTGYLPTPFPLAQKIVDGLDAHIYGDFVSAGRGCGFDRVITNLPNFPIERVDFDTTGGWHAGATGFVSLFTPVYTEDANTLFILDTTRGLPTGFTPRQLPLSCVIDVISEDVPSEIVNAFILTYLSRAPVDGGKVITGYEPSPRLVTEPETTSSDGNTVQAVERSVTDWKNLQTGQTDYTSDDVVTTRTYGLKDGVRTLLSEDTIEATYQFSGKLKTGHTRKVTTLYPNPGELDDNGQPVNVRGLVYTEIQHTDWRADMLSPGDSIMLRNETLTTGVVLVEEPQEDGAKPQYTPILEAVKGGLVKGDGTQHLETRPIKCVIERLDETGYNQAQIITTIEDRLNETVSTPPPVVSRTGSRSTAIPKLKSQILPGRQIRELIVDPASVSKYGLRRAATLSIGELDPTEGRRIVHARFKWTAEPGRRVSITIPGIDFSVRRGSVVVPPNRQGFEDSTFIVISRTITFRGLGTKRPEINMQLEAMELGG